MTFKSNCKTLEGTGHIITGIARDFCGCTEPETVLSPSLVLFHLIITSRSDDYLYFISRKQGGRTLSKFSYLT